MSCSSCARSAGSITALGGSGGPCRIGRRRHRDRHRIKLRREILRGDRVGLRPAEISHRAGNRRDGRERRLGESRRKRRHIRAKGNGHRDVRPGDGGRRKAGKDKREDVFGGTERCRGRSRDLRGVHAFPEVGRGRHHVVVRCAVRHGRVRIGNAGRCADDGVWSATGRRPLYFVAGSAGGRGPVQRHLAVACCRGKPSRNGWSNRHIGKGQRGKAIGAFEDVILRPGIETFDVSDRRGAGGLVQLEFDDTAAHAARTHRCRNRFAAKVKQSRRAGIPIHALTEFQGDPVACRVGKVGPF